MTNHDERIAVVREANESWGGIDVLINNAGISYRSVVEHTREQNRLAQLDINFRAPMELIRLVLPGMREKRDGRIINVSSVGGMMAMPTMSIYSASKFALEGATESLWYEVRPWNIKVTLLEPGFIRSKSFEGTRYTSLSATSVELEGDAYHAHYVNMTTFIATWMKRARATPDKIAKKIIKTMTRRWPPLRVAATIDAHAFSLIRRFAPRRIYHWILYRSLPGVKTWGRSAKSLQGVHTSQLPAKHTGYAILAPDVENQASEQDAGDSDSHV